METSFNLTHILLATIGFLIVYVLNGIKTEITEVKTTVRNLETNLQTGISDLNVRVSTLETVQKLENVCGYKNPHQS